MRAVLAGLLLFSPIAAHADTMTNGVPPVNSAMDACIEGRAVRYIGGKLSCAPATATPTLSSCGTSPSMSPNSTDYSGVVNVGTGIVVSCRINFTVAHVNPGIGCVTQASGLAIFGPAIDSSGITQAFTASLGGSSFSYVCYPK